MQKAYNVREAMDICETDAPDIILCDIEMPQLSGLDFLQWLREHNFESEFIFLTCHESFEYATKAIQYNVCSYLTKPFEESDIIESVLGAIDKILKNKKKEQYRQYQELWLQNQSSIYRNFWENLILNNKISNKGAIAREIQAKGLDIDAEKNYYLVVTGVRTSVLADAEWNDNSYFFAFRQIAIEVLTGELEYDHMLDYSEGTFFHVTLIIDAAAVDLSTLRSRCRYLSQASKTYLNYPASCCISIASPIQDLHKRKEDLAKIMINFRPDKDSVIYQLDLDKDCEVETGSIDSVQISRALENGDRLSVISELKNFLLNLSQNNQLDKRVMSTIHQDYLQILYAFLKDRGILANQLYSDPTAQFLFQQSVNSIFDMLKWADYFTEKALQFVSQIINTDPIIQVAKKYIEEHYGYKTWHRRPVGKGYWEEYHSA